MDDLSDPNFPNRPEHPDFWKLAEIILEMDGKFEEDPHVDFVEYLRDDLPDIESLMYMATQRALRLHGRSIGSVAAIYLEAFIVGRRFERTYGSKDE